MEFGVIKLSSSSALNLQDFPSPVESGRQSWDLSRFLKTLFFFNEPPSPAKILNLYGRSNWWCRSKGSQRLKEEGIPVRVLVRNEEKARQMLGPDIDLIVGDITRREGDTPDRQKYSQGIKFFEPEIKGDSPEKVEYIG
ncbi:hypothetical protein M0R45_013454 [Rubus argutus]|uniref:Uncharacterized protein n=1 Tax=Rubus argutus TaxID=59490 RepID=A0AAW1XJR3_RUBAR